MARSGSSRLTLSPGCTTASDERENVISVFEQHERSPLRGRCFRLELCIAHDPRCRGGIDVRILEKSLLEFQKRDAVDRLIETTFGDLSRMYGLNEELSFFGAPELIDPGVHRFAEAIDFG